MEIGRLIFILNGGLVSVAGINGQQGNKIYCEVQSVGFEKSTLQETLIVIHSLNDTSRKMIENILKVQGSVKT